MSQNWKQAEILKMIISEKILKKWIRTNIAYQTILIDKKEPCTFDDVMVT